MELDLKGAELDVKEAGLVEEPRTEVLKNGIIKNCSIQIMLTAEEKRYQL